MANTKIRKPMSSASKGVICLVVLLALTICASFLSVRGWNLDSEGINVLLPWVPVSSENWPKSLPVSRALGGGEYIEYSYAPLEDAGENAAQEAVNTIKNRMQYLGETDFSVSAKDDVIRLETRNTTDDRRSTLRSLATVGGQFELRDADSNVVLTEKDIKSANVTLEYTDANRTRYKVYLNMPMTKEGEQKLNDSGTALSSVVVDGSAVSSTDITVSGNTIKAYVGTGTSTSTTYYNIASNAAFFKNHGAVDLTLSQVRSGEVSATSQIVLKVVLLVSAALLVFSLIYLIATGKLTGVAAFLSVVCAVVINMFFIATIVVPSSYALNIGCLVAILLGILLAIYSAVTRTDAVSRQISEGAMPKQATKNGLRQCAKTVWTAHGAVLVVALILMIFTASRSTGYCLASGVVASAFAAVVMRAFQGCFTWISGKPSLFGKAK